MNLLRFRTLHSSAFPPLGSPGISGEDPIDARDGAVGARASYTRPALTVLLTGAELVEALGPAQAGYGGTGMP